MRTLCPHIGRRGQFGSIDEYESVLIPFRWFILDGWLNLVYLADVGFIAYLWRPTPNNRRFAMSDEIAQDDDGFEIASMGRESFDFDEEELAGDPNRPPAYDAPRAHRDASPLPAPVPTKPTPLPRESLDGDTIFAVGEDADKWSDSEEGEEEGKQLTSGRSEEQ